MSLEIWSYLCFVYMSLSHTLLSLSSNTLFLLSPFWQGKICGFFLALTLWLLLYLSFVCVFWSLNVYQCITACRPCLLWGLGMGLCPLLYAGTRCFYSAGVSSNPRPVDLVQLWASVRMYVRAGLRRAVRRSLFAPCLSPLSWNTPPPPQTWMFTWLNSLSTFTRAHTKYRTPYSVLKYPIRTCLSAFPFTVLSCYLDTASEYYRPIRPIRSWENKLNECLCLVCILSERCAGLHDYIYK